MLCFFYHALTLPQYDWFTTSWIYHAKPKWPFFYGGMIDHWILGYPTLEQTQEEDVGDLLTAENVKVPPMILENYGCF